MILGGIRKNNQDHRFQVFVNISVIVRLMKPLLITDDALTTYDSRTFRDRLVPFSANKKRQHGVLELSVKAR